MDQQQIDEIEKAISDADRVLGKTTDIVKVRYFSETTSEQSEREYIYFTEESLEIGDIIQCSVRNTTRKAIVSMINVPEAEIQKFRDKVKTIPSGSKLVEQETAVERIMEEPIGIATDDSKNGKVNVLLNIPDNTVTLTIKPEIDKRVIDLYYEGLKLQEYAEKAVILNEGDLKKFTDDMSVLKGLKDAIEEKRKEYLDPINLHAKTVRDTFKGFTEPFEQADKIFRSKVSAYYQEQRKRQEEADRINRLRMEAARAEAQMNNGEISESIELVETTEPPRVVRTGMGTTSMVDNWKYEVIDIDKLPREYMIPDHAMLSQTAKSHHDKKPVAGVRFYNEPVPRVTKRKY